MLQYLKDALLSKTMWGVVLMAVPPISKALGHEISPVESGNLVNSAQQAISDVFTFGGLVLSVWGRSAAKGPLGVPAAPKA